MNGDGIFQKIYKAVCQGPRARGVRSDLAALEDNYSRVEYLLNDPDLRKLLTVPPARTEKDLDAARRLKDEGNGHFQRKNHAAALSAYNKALLLAPHSDGDGLLAVCYANRSAALFHTGRHSDCLADISRAIEAGYPQEALYKLLIRKAKCHQHVSVNEKPNAVRAALQALGTSGLDATRKTVWEKDLLKVTADPPKPAAGSDGDDNLSLTLDRSNDLYPALSSAVMVAESAEFGRYIQADADISAGDVILRERPYCSVTLPDYYPTHCSHCQRRVGVTPAPCRGCADAVYCGGGGCQAAAWDAYHRFECKHMANIRDVNINMGHLALRTALQAGAENLLSVVNGETTVEGDPYSSHDYINVFRLEGHEDDRSADDLFWRAVAAAVLSGLCDTDLWGQGHENPRTLLAAVTLHHMQVFPCNAHEISDMLYEESAPCHSRLLEVGAGIYATLSYFNHSCDPTVVRTFAGGNACVVKALGPVQRGHQLFDNYGCLYAVHPLAERRAKMAAQYYFECGCDACVRDWPPYADMSYEATPIYRCPACASAIFDDECQKCGQAFDRTATDAALARAKTAFDQVLSQLFVGEVGGSELRVVLNKLTAYSNLVNRLVLRPYRTLNDCQEALKHVYNMSGNRWSTGGPKPSA